MPHLREISLCSLLFADGNRLGAASLDLLANQIRPNSNLELFCLTNGEISEVAVSNLQRCRKLQILVLLRCTILSKYPELPLMMGWHPNSSLPGSLITDDVTVPRWLKPTYFHVVRVDNFTEFSKDKVVNLRERLWTIRALLNSPELNLPDFCFASLARDCLLHTQKSLRQLVNLRSAMATRARLQRRLEAKQKEEAGKQRDDVTTIPRPAPKQLNRFLASLGVSAADLDAAENSGPSLFEELSSPDLREYIVEHFPKKNWSLRRVLAIYAISDDAPFNASWAGFVKMATLQRYYQERESAFLEFREQYVGQSAMALLRRWSGVELAKMTAANRILMAIFRHLNMWDCLGLVVLVCRRWHFVARCVWNRIDLLQIHPANAPFSPAALLKTSEIVFRMPMLTNVTLCGGISIPVTNLPSIFRRNDLPPLDTLRIYDISFVTTTISLKDANERVCDFLRSRSLLKELVLVDANVCFLDVARNRREMRSLDLWYFEFIHTESDEPLLIDYIQLSVKTLQRFTDNFKIFCKQVLQCSVNAIILCGGVTTNYATGLSESIFAQGFALLMPHLREVSLCSLSFADGNRLGASSLDLLCRQIRRNSNLELFCLINAEISEEAICSLQRCGKLQILILLRCSIISKDRDLRSLAGWHPSCSLPSSLITDDVTVPRWLKPTYFRVVRVDQLTEFGGNKFVNLRNRFWSLRALLQSAELGLQDFCFPSLYLNPEEIFGDGVWLLHG